jgi:hypothetical protein
MTTTEIHQKSKKCENMNWKTSTPHEHIDHGNTFLHKLTTIKKKECVFSAGNWTWQWTPWGFVWTTH